MWAAAALLCTSCYRTSVTVDTLKRHRTERRIPREPGAALVRGPWRVEPDAIVSQLDLQICQTFRTWTAAKVRTTKEEPVRGVAVASATLGVATGLVGAATWSSETTLYCDGHSVGKDPYLVIDQSTCHWVSPDNTVSKVMFGSSLVFWTLAAVTWLQRSRTNVQVLDETRHGTVTSEACLSPRDLEQLLLVVRGPHGRIWPVRLSSNGQARIPLPQSPDLPRDANLELVVYRAPAFSAGLLYRGQVLDTFRLQPAGVPSPPDPSNATFPAE